MVRGVVNNRRTDHPVVRGSYECVPSQGWGGVWRCAWGPRDPTPPTQERARMPRWHGNLCISEVWEGVVEGPTAEKREPCVPVPVQV